MTQTATNWEKKIAVWQQATGVKPQAIDEHAGHEMKEKKTETKSKLNTDVQASLSKMLNNYYGVKNALIADDGKTANAQASEFVKMLSKVPMEKMTAEQHTLFMDLLGKTKSDAQRISETKEVKNQRERFNDLSNNFFAMLKGLNANEQPVYQQYCPMAKGYWLSDNSAVKNPYYGKSMLTCGKVTETLK